MISGFVLLSIEFNQGHLYPSGLELSIGRWAPLWMYNWRQCLPLPRMSVAHSFAVMADAPTSLHYPWLTVGRASLGQNLCGQPQMVWWAHATVDCMAFHNPSPYCYSAPALFLAPLWCSLSIRGCFKCLIEGWTPCVTYFRHLWQSWVSAFTSILFRERLLWLGLRAAFAFEHRCLGYGVHIWLRTSCKLFPRSLSL